MSYLRGLLHYPTCRSRGNKYGNNTNTFLVVPQCTILEPILFHIYTSDETLCFSDDNIYLYCFLETVGQLQATVGNTM